MAEDMDGYGQIEEAVALLRSHKVTWERWVTGFIKSKDGTEQVEYVVRLTYRKNWHTKHVIEQYYLAEPLDDDMHTANLLAAALRMKELF